jgi:hypothetical protein
MFQEPLRPFLLVVLTCYRALFQLFPLLHGPLAHSSPCVEADVSRTDDTNGNVDRLRRTNRGEQTLVEARVECVLTGNEDVLR